MIQTGLCNFFLGGVKTKKINYPGLDLRDLMASYGYAFNSV